MSEWISVDNFLPTDGQPCLVVWQGVTQDVTFIYEDEIWFAYDVFDENYRGEPVLDNYLTHWQPLPPPPK